jgi:hypothetical protein
LAGHCIGRYLRLVNDNDYLHIRAPTNIHHRLQEETARVEKCLLDGSFTEAIVKCFTTPKANAFDHNLLEPLQKLLRLSPPVAASLARFDMFSGVHQKLNHKKAVIRLNLLRIVRSICDPHEEQAIAIRNHPLFEAIETLAETDSAVLVRNMASELVRSTLEMEIESSSGSRTRHLRRTGSHPSPVLLSGHSTPSTPTHGPRASGVSLLLDEAPHRSMTPRRSMAPPEPSDGLIYRPRSRDGPIGTRRTSAELTGTPAVKSRLPRTAALRQTRSSMAAPGIRDASLGRDTTLEPLVKKENGQSSRIRGEVKTSSSSASMSQLNSKRRPRAPSGDIKWS